MVPMLSLCQASPSVLVAARRRVICYRNSRVYESNSEEDDGCRPYAPFQALLPSIRGSTPATLIFVDKKERYRREDPYKLRITPLSILSFE
jgi:hypothetical protein